MILFLFGGVDQGHLRTENQFGSQTVTVFNTFSKGFVCFVLPALSWGNHLFESFLPISKYVLTSVVFFIELSYTCFAVLLWKTVVNHIQ